MSLRNKVAIVTGAGQGIGKAVALKLAAEGAKVCIADLNEQTGRSVVQLIRDAGNDAINICVDVTDYMEVENMVNKTIEKLGVPDILVNNAGWDKIELFLSSSRETWDKVIDINLKGPINCIRAVLPYLVEKKYGKVLSIASDAGRVGSTGEAVYSGAKGGIIAFSKTIAREMARYSINVNCICPGPTETPLFDEIAAGNAKIAEGLKKAIPLRRLGKPEDIANAVAFLVSDEANYITGQALSVNGGLAML